MSYTTLNLKISVRDLISLYTEMLFSMVVECVDYYLICKYAVPVAVRYQVNNVETHRGCVYDLSSSYG